MSNAALIAVAQAEAEQHEAAAEADPAELRSPEEQDLRSTNVDRSAERVRAAHR